MTRHPLFLWSLSTYVMSVAARSAFLTTILSHDNPSSLRHVALDLIALDHAAPGAVSLPCDSMKDLKRSRAPYSPYAR